MFDSLLIANRGEIARRIIRTARRMGLRTIAVYSEADADAPFVRDADEAICIGPAPARQSYLSVDAIMDAARRSGAGAIHPGYGFLSENPALPLACDADGIVFVGPTARTIEDMGSKIGAKRLAVAAQVPVIPGFDADDGDDAKLLQASAAIGYPMLVKASAGGGGKGMRAVTAPDQLADALLMARREAKAAFGDDRLLLERLVGKARHVEVQIAADHHGNVVHLFDRDCSVQRNNQKVLEEAPAPGLDPAMRARLLGDAVRLAASIGYRNLGTMEFLVDAATGEHFFLEMNTRLQVEHPVTEAVTGLDLVELQLNIAAGQPLPFTQDDLTASGHAIEARLTAERPEAGFAPSAGRIELWLPPPESDGIRIDAGVGTGSEVTVHYDSMIAKVIAHGKTRDEARQKLARALRRMVVLGLETNRSFLADICESAAFSRGMVTTDCLPQLYPQGWTRHMLDPELAATIGATLWAASRQTGETVPEASVWSRLGSYRLTQAAGRAAVQEFTVIASEWRHSARIIMEGLSGRAVPEGSRPVICAQIPQQGQAVQFLCDGQRGTALVQGHLVCFSYAGAEYSLHVDQAIDAHENAAAAARMSDSIVAPMPGIIAEVLVSPGQEVQEGTPVIVLESMKLLQTMLSPREGRVAAVHVAQGQSLSAGIEMITLEAAMADLATEEQL